MRKITGLSFKKRIFYGCLLAALGPVLCSGFITMQVFTASVNHRLLDEGTVRLEAARERLAELLIKGGEACNRLRGDGYTAWAMIDNKSVERQKDLYLLLYQEAQTVYSRANYSVYDVGGKLRFSTDPSASQESLPVNWGLLRKACEGQGISYYRTDPVLQDSKNETILQGACTLESAEGIRTGYVVLDFTREDFDDLFQGFYSPENRLLILDSHQKPIYCSDPEYGAAEMEQMKIQTMEGRKRTVRSRIPTRYLWVQEPEYGFYILLQCSSPISLVTMKMMGTVSLVLSGLGFVFSLLIAGILSRSMGKPVSQLDRAMAKVKEGDLTIRITSSRQDELGRLTQRFNEMTEDLQHHLEEKVQKQKDLNQATLKLYQTQLNPHFLYNTLDSICWSARIHQVPEIAVMSEHLAVILRKSISGKPFISLEEELSMIDSYIEIQKIRFSGRFLYEKEIPDQLGFCMVPKMILQPLVENAILHGLEGCKNGYICIYAAKKEEILYISVTDDGKGMPKEMIDWINSDNPARREGHLGLYNVIHILKIYYGEEAGVSASVTEEGTTVTLRIPARKEAPDV